MLHESTGAGPTFELNDEGKLVALRAYSEVDRATATAHKI